MKPIFTFFLVLIGLSLSAQEIADFEDYDLAPETFLNGSDGNGGFLSGDVFLPNTFFPADNFWTGWSISNTTDVTTPGFMNQYSSVSGSGVDGSENYAVSFSLTSNILILEGEAAGKVVDGMYINNGTYAFLSMRDGDSFAKKFGGISGNDEDYFLLTIKKYYNGELSTDSIDFYLADYRFADNSQDYILDEWTFVDLKPLGPADSLSFSLSSTDNNEFGMVTPAYFCVDNISSTNLFTDIEEVSTEASISIYPNPTSDYLQIEAEAGTVRIFNKLGQLVVSRELVSSNQQLDLRSLAPGAYYLDYTYANQRSSQVLIIQ